MPGGFKFDTIGVIVEMKNVAATRNGGKVNVASN